MDERTIWIVEVCNDCEEHAVLEARKGRAIVPLKGDDEVREAIVSVARRQGIPVRSCTFEGAWRDSELPCGYVRETRIVAVGRLDPSVLSLVQSLGGSLVHGLEGLKRLQATEGAIEEALVLFAPQDDPAALRQVMAWLAKRKVSFAVLPGAPVNGARKQLAQALLFQELDITDIHSLGDVGRDTADVNGSTALMVMAGHGNVEDVGEGGMMACGRGQGEAADALATFPCYRDGKCFRQPLFDRPVTSREGVVDPAMLEHPVVLLLGCGTLPLGDEPFAMSGTILARIMDGGAVGGVATIGIVFSDTKFEKKLVSLLTDGYPLGETVKTFNAWYKDLYGHATPTSDGYGPLVAFGHPGMRVSSLLTDTQDVNSPVNLDFSTCLDEARAMRSSATSFPFWDTVLTEFGAERGSTTHAITRYLGLKPFEADTDVVSPDMLAAHQAVFAMWLKWQRAMLNAVHGHQLDHGGFAFHIWRGHYRFDGEQATSLSCPVCHEECAPLRYRSFCNDADEILILQCPVCGVLGQQPHWLSASLEQCSYDVAAQCVDVVLSIRSESEGAAYGFFQATRECWNRTSPDVSACGTCCPKPGQDETLELSVPIRSALTDGLYSINVLGVTNGGLSQLRFHLPLEGVRGHA